MFAVGILDVVEVEAFLNDVADALHLLGNLFGNLDVEFHPVHVFHESHALELLGIIFVVVDGGISANLVEPHNQASLRIHVGEAQRACELGHAFFFVPLGYGIEERVGNFVVIDKVKPSKAALFLVVSFVEPVVDDAGDAPNGLAVAIGHIIYALAKIKRGIFLGHQRAYLIADESRHITLIITVKNINREFHILAKFFLGRFNFSNFYCHNTKRLIFNECKDTVFNLLVQFENQKNDFSREITVN